MRGRHRPLFAIFGCASLAVVLAGCGRAITPANAGAPPVPPTIAAPMEPAMATAATGTAVVAAEGSIATATGLTPAANSKGAVSMSGAGDDLAPLGDEFDNAASLASWNDLNQVERFPSRVEQVDVNTTSPGHLYLVPYRSSWYEDYRGVFLYKEVTGDFDVRTRIQATGKAGDLPTIDFSLAGLMARAPRDITMQTWKAGQENWIFITTGYGDDAPRRVGKPQIETKTTTNSRSNLRLILSRSGWVDLRIVRIGATFLMIYRLEGKPWTVSRRFVRPDLPQTLQVGLNAYSAGSSSLDAAAYNRSSHTEPGDLIVRSDYMRFQRPRVPEAVKEQVAADKLAFSELLRILGE